MFLNRGFDNPPTTTKYWKKINTLNGGEIVIDKKKMAGEKGYTAAVFAKEDSKFSLILMPEFHNLINLKYQHLVQ